MSFDASLLPMLSPPLPWHSYRHGGYLATDVSLVRLPPYASQQRFRLENNPAQQLYPALDALNALGSIPWRINSAILDLVIQIFNSNGDKELDVPQPPSALQPPLPIPKESPQTEKSKAMKGAVFLFFFKLVFCVDFVYFNSTLGICDKYFRPSCFQAPKSRDVQFMV